MIIRFLFDCNITKFYLSLQSVGLFFDEETVFTVKTMPKNAKTEGTI